MTDGSRRREAFAAALVGVVAFLPFLRGVTAGRSLYFRDLAGQFFPLRRLALEGLRAGDVRFWNPYLHEGIPLSLPAVGYPLDALQLLRPDEVGMSLVLLLHVPLAALGAYTLIRRLFGLPRVAAAGGALVYALGGFVLSTVNLYVLAQAAAWAPFVVLTVARATAGAGRRAVAGAALVWAVAVATTGVEIAAQAALVGLVLGLHRRKPGWARALAGAGSALGLGTLLAAPVLVLVASQISGSARGGGLTTEVVLAHSVHPFTFVQSVVGGLYGNLSNLAEEWWGQNFFPHGFPYILSLYLGVVALATASVGARSRHAMSTRLVGLVGAALVLCLGRWAGIGALIDHVPWLRLLRYPVKAYFTAQLGVSLLVALGLDRLASAERRSWRRLAVVAAAGGGLLTLAPLLPWLAPDASASFSALFLPPGLDPGARAGLLSRVLADAAAGGAIALAAAGVAVLVQLERLPPFRGAILVVGLLAGDLLRTGTGLNPMVEGSFFRPSPELASMLDSLRDDRVFTCRFETSRAYQEARRAKRTGHEIWTFAVALETLTPDFNVSLGVPTALSPDRTMLVPTDRVLSPKEVGCRDVGRLLPRLRRAGVQTMLSLDPLSHPGLAQVEQMRPARLAPLSVHVYRLEAALPRVEVASLVSPAESAADAREKAMETEFLARGGAAVEGAEPVAGVRGHVLGVSRHRGQLKLSVEADRPTLVVVRDGWSPGWTARVNGRPAEVRRANGRHCAVPVPAGRSEVTLRYRPPGLEAALTLGGLALVVVIGLLGPWHAPARRHPSG